MNGTSVRWMKIEFSRPTSLRIWRIDSRNGRLSISPTVPPISTIATSTSCATRRIVFLISLVMCGMTWTVLPRYSPLRSFSMTPR